MPRTIKKVSEILNNKCRVGPCCLLLLNNTTYLLLFKCVVNFKLWIGIVHWHDEYFSKVYLHHLISKTFRLSSRLSRFPTKIRDIWGWGGSFQLARTFFCIWIWCFFRLSNLRSVLPHPDYRPPRTFHAG